MGRQSLRQSTTLFQSTTASHPRHVYPVDRVDTATFYFPLFAGLHSNGSMLTLSQSATHAALAALNAAGARAAHAALRRGSLGDAEEAWRGRSFASEALARTCQPAAAAPGRRRQAEGAPVTVLRRRVSVCVSEKERSIVLQVSLSGYMG